jgi:hypothetical protein
MVCPALPFRISYIGMDKCRICYKNKPWKKTNEEIAEAFNNMNNMEHHENILFTSTLQRRC